MRLRKLNRYAELCALVTIAFSAFMEDMLFGSYIMFVAVFVGGILNSLKLKQCYNVMNLSKKAVILDEFSYVGGLTFGIIMLDRYGDSDSPYMLLTLLGLIILLAPWAILNDRIKSNSCIVDK